MPIDANANASSSSTPIDANTNAASSSTPIDANTNAASSSTVNQTNANSNTLALPLVGTTNNSAATASTTPFLDPIQQQIHQHKLLTLEQRR